VQVSFSAASPLSGKLVSTGSDTLGSLTALWAEALMRDYPGVTVQVRAIGSGAAPTALIEGTADIGPMSRPMSEAEEHSFARRYGYAPTAVPVALDAIAVFVHRDNPLELLTVRQLDAVFSATRRCGGPAALGFWGELGLGGRWSRRFISVYGRSAASGTYSFFRREVLCRGDFSNGVNRLVGSSAVVRAVGDDPEGIGYASAGYVNSNVRRLRVVEEDRVTPVSLSRRLYLYVNAPPARNLDPVVSAFLSMALGDEGQREVLRSGYLALPEPERALLRSKLLLPVKARQP
jgi:phosphate transport system substrate-binding protein